MILSYNKLNVYISLLTENNLIEFQSINKSKYSGLHKKGLKFLKIYNESL